jgi:hypothetical protein
VSSSAVLTSGFAGSVGLLGSDEQPRRLRSIMVRITTADAGAGKKMRLVFALTGRRVRVSEPRGEAARNI